MFIIINYVKWDLKMKLSKGLTLVEVLVSLLLVTIAMLTVVNLQVMAFRQAKVAYYRDLAIQQLSLAVGLIRASHEHYQKQYKNWQRQTEKLLPHSHGTIARSHDIFHIAVTWQLYDRFNLQLTVS